MKKLILGAAALLCLASCSYRVYPTGSLEDNYRLAMQSAEEQAIKENVAIYLSENEVPGPYKLIAFVENRPILPVAIASQQLKNFYKQAVLKANEMGGNAIIVNSIRSFKVINVTGRPVKRVVPPHVTPDPRPRPEPKPRFIPVQKEEKPAVEETTKTEPTTIFRKKEKPAREDNVKEPTQAAPVQSTPAPAPKKEVVETKASPKTAETTANSPIFDETTAQWFTSGYVYRAKEQEQTEIIDAMNAEIRENLKICKTREEMDCISKKIELLENYNKALPIPSGTQANKIKAYRNTLKKLGAKLGEAQESSGNFVDGAVQSVKGFFENLRK